MPMLDFYSDKMSKINTEQEAMVKTCEDEENRDFSPDEQTHYDTLTKDWETTSANHKREEERAARSAKLKPRKAIVPPGQGNPKKPGEEDNGIPKLTFYSRKAPAGFADVEQAYRAGKWLISKHGNQEDRSVQEATQWCKDYGVETRVMTGISANKGSAVVPEEFSTALINLQEEYGVARKFCRMMPMGTDVMVVPRVIGNTTAYYIGEETAITASDMKLDNISLTPRTLAALSRVSNILLADSAIEIAGLLTKDMARQFALAEDNALFLGDGTATYGGISGLITKLAAATASIVTSQTTNIAFSDMDFVDFESMIGKLPEFPGIMPEWYIHKAAFYASMARLANAAGGNTMTDIAGGPSRVQFLGYPVNFVNVMNSTLTDQADTAGLCYFGDLAMAATFGNRQDVQTDSDSSIYFTTNQTAIRAIERYDINVHDVGDTSDPGPVIMLKSQTS